MGRMLGNMKDFLGKTSRGAAEMPAEGKKDSRKAGHDQNLSRNNIEESHDQNRGSRTVQECYLLCGLEQRVEI